MPDMHDAMKQAGFKGAERRDVPQGKGGLFPVDYPNYFDNSGILKSEYIDALPDHIAEQFGKDRPTLTMHQLRTFYHYVKQREAALRRKRPWPEIHIELKRLKEFAHERESKRKIPRVFKEFIVRNVDCLTNQKSFEKGFVEHFQAVVAFSAGRVSERER